MSLTFPEDRTGLLASNKISNEQFTLTAVNNRNFHLFIPKFAPFFADGFKLFQNINGTQLPLDEGIDFNFCYKFESASLSTGKPIYGGVDFNNLALEGSFSATYQTVGDDWTLDDQKILEITANEIYNPRGRTWDQIHGKPKTFGPTSHIQDASDFLSEQKVGEKLDAIAEAIANNQRPVNTQPITLQQLGIPKIGNWSMATLSEALEGKSSDTLINPLTLKAVLDKLGISQAALDMENFRKHIINKDNPHETDKESIELNNVQNLGVAPTNKIIADQDDEGLVTLTQLRAYLRIHGCQTAPEEEPVYVEKGSLLSYRCTSNYDRIGIFADGLGHTYEKIIESNSVDCGYRPPVQNKYPAHGTILQYYCLDFDRWKIVADGYGNSYHVFVLANSGDCGYTGGDLTTKPPAGTLLSAYCDGRVLVQTLANGSGGSYENRVPGHSDCAGNTTFPDRGILVGTYCDNKNEIGRYTDGSGGIYTEVLNQNAAKCGYVVVVTPTPVTFPPFGTPMGDTCIGTTLVNKFSDGRGSYYTETVAANSPRCGFTSTTPGPTVSPTGQPTIQPTPGPTSQPGNNASITYSTTMSYLTPSTTAKERHTVAIRNGKPNHTYNIRFFLRTSAGATLISHTNTLSTNTMGEGTYTLETGVYGKDPTASFVPDDTYQCWIESDDNLRSNTVVRTFAGFGTTPGGNKRISLTSTPTTIHVGTLKTITITLEGWPPSTYKTVRLWLEPVRSGFRTFETYKADIFIGANGSVVHVIRPGAPTGPSTLVPDASYNVWAEVDGVTSPAFVETWATGSTLRLEDSLLAW